MATNVSEPVSRLRQAEAGSPVVPRDGPRSARPSVCMIVGNTVSHDIRVLKEASSLSRQGYPVTVIGVRKNRRLAADERLAGGVRIVRLAQRGITSLHACLALACGGFVIGCAMALAGWHAALSPQVIAASSLLALLVLVRTSWLLVCTKSLNLLRGHSWRRNVLRQLRELRPEIVHCHDFLTLPIGCAYVRRSRCKLVFDSHELAEHQRRPAWKRRLLALFQGWCSRHVDGFITVNPSIARYFAENYPHMPRPTVVMNASVPCSDLPLDDGRLHSAAELPRRTKILLYQGGFSKGRGLATLVEAAAWLPDDWCLVMMGSGRYGKILRRMAEGPPQRRRRIRFIRSAPLDELTRWTAGATVGAILYEKTCLNHWFCSPNKLWEYPNAGVPILACRFPELERVIQANGIGWFLPDPVEPRAIADHVARLADDQLQSKRRNCRDFIRRDNWRVYERRLSDLYDQLRDSLDRGRSSDVPVVG